MKSNAPFPITEGTFSQCWEFVDGCCCKARRKSAVARIAGYLTMQFFLLLLVFLANGVISDRLTGSYCSFLETLPGFLSLWEAASGFLLKSGDSFSGDVLRLAAFAYVVSAMVFGVLAGLIYLLYHPRKKSAPEGSFVEITAALEKAAREAREYARKSRISTSVVAVVLTIAAAFLLLFYYIFQLQNAAVVSQALSRFPTSDVATNCLLYVAAAYVICELLGSLLLLITRPVYRYDFPMDYVAQAQTAALQAKEPGLDAKALLTEAVTLEKEGSYNSAYELFRKAALLGDGIAMEHYGRHYLLKHMQDNASYWLDKAAVSGNSSSSLKKMRLRLKLGMQAKVQYLKPDQDPPSTGKKVLTILGSGIKLLWRLLILAVFAIGIFVMFILFKTSTDPGYQAELPEGISVLVDKLQSALNQLNDSVDAYVPEEAVQKKPPVMALTAEGTRWEQNCILYDEFRQPVIFCYGKDLGGSLYIPHYRDKGQKIHKAAVYTGNQWDLRSIKKHVSHIPETQTLVIAEEYLMGLEPGEYFIIVDDSQYIPILVSEQTDYDTPQRGMAAQGNRNGWIVSDLENPRDITLFFYNLGNSTITGVSETRQLVMLPKPAVTELDSTAFTISDDGHSITLLAEYLQQKEAGSYFDLKLTLSSGEILEIRQPHIGTVQGDFDGLMQITGSDTYSLSKGGDLVLSYSFGLQGVPQNLTVSSDSAQNFIEENLSGLTSDYIDFDSQTITIPEALLKASLVQDEDLHVGIGYSTAFSQFGFCSFTIHTKR